MSGINFQSIKKVPSLRFCIILTEVVIALEILDQKTKGSLPQTTVQSLDAHYNLSSTSNVEIGLKWFMLCLHNDYQPAFPAAAQFSTRHGRMKYCRPILRGLFANEAGKELALNTFSEYRDFYHPHAAHMIAKDLGLH